MLGILNHKDKDQKLALKIQKSPIEPAGKIHSNSFASAEVLDKSEHWKNFVAIYGWVPAMTGDVKVKGVDANVDLTGSGLVLVSKTKIVTNRSI
jgi:hypothetical protein